MEQQILNFFLGLLLLVIFAGGYIWLLHFLRNKKSKPTPEKIEAKLPKTAPVVPFLESVQYNFLQALKQALPEKYVICVNVPIEKLFDVSCRKDIRMTGQYADYVVFTSSYVPVLIVDLFDMSIINLDRVNKIRTASKEILRNSGIPVLDYQYTDNCNIDELRRKIADILNPLRTIN